MTQEEQTQQGLPQSSQQQDSAPEGQPAPSISSLEEELAALRPKLEEAERERKQFKELAQRAQADLINFRKRVDQDREELERSANARLLRKLLPIIDDLALALGHVSPQEANAPWVEGVRLIHRKLLALLESEGVTPMAAEGQPFDPWEHEALLYQESETAEDGRVISVVRQGYKLHGRVLRPAQVVVARRPEPQAPQEAETGPSSEG